MKKRILQGVLAVAAPVVLWGCDTTPEAAAPDANGDPPAATETDAEETTLEIFGNGEERPQVGFTSGDGWELSFDHIYANFTDLKAYQTDPPYDYLSLEPIQDPEEEVSFGDASVDLVTGDEDNPTVFLADATDVPEGHYNAISYRLSPASDGPGEDYSLVIIGTAERDGETIDFVLNLEQELDYYCGEFIGDQRKGIVETGETADLEATLHFDHLFGEGSRPADDPLNQSAFGFDPLAALAEDGQVEADMAMLEEMLSEADYARLESSLIELGHAGEGHCFEAVSGQTS
ncbi:DUF4382 domain-containing protein [Nodosilinea sp. P-1105]|uniref:DUF4382 domain-containing protein n=1 Tax=Nodosilinea sp. P-1105 TaxID=2546229 RepID=UPI00146ADF3F|nr:DUF4382 domain-containing protein [Nodosilinea sp. P-1105]NMF84423.1 DUF4382 domain-containing protein [Nodosilinea sp. P-1105]